MQGHHFGPQLTGQLYRILIFKFRLEGGLDIVRPHLCAAVHRRIEKISRIHAAGKGQCRPGILFKKLR